MPFFGVDEYRKFEVAMIADAWSMRCEGAAFLMSGDVVARMAEILFAAKFHWSQCSIRVRRMLALAGRVVLNKPTDLQLPTASEAAMPRAAK